MLMLKRHVVVVVAVGVVAVVTDVVTDVDVDVHEMEVRMLHCDDEMNDDGANLALMEMKRLVMSILLVMY
jgi:hypothetical protein